MRYFFFPPQQGGIPLPSVVGTCCGKIDSQPVLILTSQALAVDLLNPPASVHARTHKLKKIVPEPNSFFMDVKCPGCFQITYVLLLLHCFTVSGFIHTVESA